VSRQELHRFHWYTSYPALLLAIITIYQPSAYHHHRRCHPSTLACHALCFVIITIIIVVAVL
jgi:hypothetical protein